MHTLRLLSVNIAESKEHFFIPQWHEETVKNGRAFALKNSEIMYVPCTESSMSNG